MAELFANLTRSELMSRIRGTGNKTTELRMVALLRASGTKGWRRHANLAGKPDFIFPESKVAIFVDGCFWHGCPTHFKMPKGNAEFWRNKIALNRRRDRRVDRELRKQGWRVIRVWEHSLRVQEVPNLLKRLHSALASKT